MIKQIFKPVTKTYVDYRPFSLCKTSEDATAVGDLTLEQEKSWVNGSDSTIGGTFNENEWRFTSVLNF